MAQVLARLHEHASPQAIALVLFIFLVAVLLARSTSRAEKLLDKIPSPPFKLPLIGHLHLMGSLPHISLRDLAMRHGPDVMLLRLGTLPTLVVSSPRAAKAILRTHDHVFASRPPSAAGDILYTGSTNVANAPYGDYWRQIRKIVTTHLLTAKKVRSNFAACEPDVRLVLARLKETTATRTAVDLSELFSYFASDVLCRAVLGRLPRKSCSNKLLHDLIHGNSDLLGGFNLDDYFPILARLNMVAAKAVRHKKRWDDLLDDLINQHTSKTVGEDEEEDFIDVLLSVQQEYSLTDYNIKAILMDMFEAGIHTTFIALDYAMAELMRKPRVMSKLQTEVRRCETSGKEVLTQEDMRNLTYLKAVMKETLRLHPSGPLLAPHFSMADCAVEGYIIPSGTRVILNVWAMGRDATCWDSPEEFMPERFLDEAMDGASDFQGNDFRFLPFGTGRRMCPAISFATATFEIILANLMYHFNWELPAGSLGVDMTEVFGLDVQRKEKLLLIPRISEF